MNKLKKPVKKNITPLKKNHSRDFFFCFIVFVFCFILYGNSIKHDYVLDDDFVTRKNSFVQKGIDGIGEIFSHGYFKGFNNVNNQLYRPIVLTSFAIETNIFGNDPHMNHFFNVFFYAIASVLLFLLMRRILPDDKLFIPFIITLLFVAHPIHTEVVASIKSRDEILAFLFLMISFILLIDFVTKKRQYLLIFSVITFLLSVLSKESAISVVGVIPFFLYFFSKLEIKKILLYSSPFLFVSLVFLAVRNQILDPFNPLDEVNYLLNNALLGAHNFYDLYSTVVFILGKYLALLFIPYPLSCDYSFNQIPIKHITDFRVLISLLVYLSLIGFVIWKLKSKNVIAFAILFYLLTISISSNLVIRIGCTMAERFLFLPSLGFCLAVTIGFIRLLKQTGNNKFPWISFVVCSGIIITIYSVITVNRNNDWENNFTLFSSAIIVSPNSAAVQSQFGNATRVLGEQSRDAGERNRFLRQTVTAYRRSLEIYPEFSDAAYNLGVSYQMLGNNDSAMVFYRKCHEIDPKFISAMNNIGSIYFDRKLADSAIIWYQKIVEADDHNSDAYGNIGVVFHMRGDVSKALEFYSKALNLNPENKTVLRNLIILYTSSGDKQKADLYTTKLNQIK